MDPTSYFGQNILSVLNALRDAEEVVEYSKVEGDEFVKLPEMGVYLHSKNGDGVVFDCRIYFEKRDGFFSSGYDVRGRFMSAATVSDLEDMLGKSTRDIRSIRIPTRLPTLPGKEFSDGANTVKAFCEDGSRISYIHITKSDLARS